MGRRFLITGTDTGVGKTTVGCALGFAFRARGIRVGVMKPVETGCVDAAGILEPADARSLALAASCTVPLELICPYRYRSPLAPAVAAEMDRLAPPDLAVIKRYFGEIAAQSDTVIVEGAGGITVPITWTTDFADLASESMLDLEVVVVVGNRLGCLNAAILTMNYIGSRSLRIAGYVLCDIEPAETLAAQTNEASLQRLLSAPCLGRMRHREPLAKTIVEKLL